MGNLDREAALVWKSLRHMRLARAAGDVAGVEEARYNLELYAQITPCAAIRERCTAALIADENLPAAVAVPA